MQCHLPPCLLSVKSMLSAVFELFLACYLVDRHTASVRGVAGLVERKMAK